MKIIPVQPSTDKQSAVAPTRLGNGHRIPSRRTFGHKVASRRPL
jgi:hypothetical protein